MLLVLVALPACGPGGSEGGSPGAARIRDAGPVHVHGLGVDPRDGALLVATHTGLFRAGQGERRPVRVGDRMQDTMGFTVAGRDRFLGSGHPDLRDDLPPFLGLIESRDGGRTWKSVSLLGEVDFHVLEASGRFVYGSGSEFKTRRAVLMVSRDGGRTWSRRRPPGVVLSLAIDPRDPSSVVVGTEQGLVRSSDGGRGWSAPSGVTGLLAWPSARTLYRVDADGAVAVSEDAGRRWRPVGDVGAEPAVFDTGTAREILVALHDGRILRSGDGGRRWSLRAVP